MKVYALGYELINDSMNFYVYTCKFLSSRQKIDEKWYEDLKSSFTISGKNNKSFSGIYFDCI